MCIRYLGISPFEYEYRYSQRDLQVYADHKQDGKRDLLEGLRLHAFLVMSGFTKKLKKPQQLLRFNWEKEVERDLEKVDQEELEKRMANLLKFHREMHSKNA